MIDQRLTAKTELNETPHNDDVIHIVDVSDTTHGPEGTSKKIKYSNLVEGSSSGVSNTQDVAVAHEIDWSLGNSNLTMTANTVFTESNLPPLGVEKTITVYLYGLFSPTDVLAWGIIGQPYDGVNGSQIVVHWKGDGTYHAVRNDLV